MEKQPTKLGWASESESGTRSGVGWIPLPASVVERRGTASAPGRGTQPDWDLLRAALRSTIDATADEMFLCSAAGALIYANPRASDRLARETGRERLEAEIRFLCVALRLEIAEHDLSESEEPAVSLHRSVSISGEEIQLQAVDLGIRTPGRLPAVLVVARPQAHWSDRVLDESGLTRAEMRVARLLVERLGNREIARRLSISTHTVRHHVQHILEKLGIHSRTEVAEAIRGIHSAR